MIIAVSDTGAGIPKENMTKIFRPFFTTKKKKGMGLGLSICERIVEAHGGRILVESAPGKGTTFYLHFPLRETREYGRAS
jgi:signal transduction histidine kinase